MARWLNDPHIHHFGCCLYIRNQYIYNREFPEIIEPDDLSGIIMDEIIADLLEEYNTDDRYIKQLYSNKEFLNQRRRYFERLGEYPVDIILKVKKTIQEEMDLYCESLNELDNLEDESQREEFRYIYNLLYELINSAMKKCEEEMEYRIKNNSKLYMN